MKPAAPARRNGRPSEAPRGNYWSFNIVFGSSTCDSERPASGVLRPPRRQAAGFQGGAKAPHSRGRRSCALRNSTCSGTCSLECAGLPAPCVLPACRQAARLPASFPRGHAVPLPVTAPTEPNESILKHHCGVPVPGALRRTAAARCRAPSGNDGRPACAGCRPVPPAGCT